MLRRTLLSFAILFSVGGLGSLGYFLLWRDEGASFLDASYMTFITITTIGFHEVRPLGTAGRLLTMVIAVTGIGSLFYLFTSVMDFLVTSQFGGSAKERRMLHSIERLRGHIIVAGLGRVGRQAAHELLESGHEVVVADVSEAAMAYAEEHQLVSVKGDCTLDEVLNRCGIEHAAGLIATTDSDATNLYVVITARLLNPNLRIVSRVVDEASTPKLLRAGANRAISPYAIGGRRLAQVLSRATVIDFFESALKGQSLGIEEVEVTKRLSARPAEVGSLLQRGGATVVAVIRGDTVLANPSAELALAEGDRVLALGTPPQLRELTKRVEVLEGE